MVILFKETSANDSDTAATNCADSQPVTNLFALNLPSIRYIIIITISVIVIKDFLFID